MHGCRGLQELAWFAAAAGGGSLCFEGQSQLTNGSVITVLLQQEAAVTSQELLCQLAVGLDYAVPQRLRQVLAVARLAGLAHQLQRRGGLVAKSVEGSVAACQQMGRVKGRP